MHELVLFHSPRTRSSTMLYLLEELGIPYDLHVLQPGQQREPEFLAIKPMGKVAALRGGEAVVTGEVAITMYLADRFPGAGLAPALDDPLRGPYLRWLAFYGSSFEPAVVDRAMQRDPGGTAMSPYGDFDTMLRTVTDQLARGPHLLGDRFTAADVLWGSGLGWTTMFKIVPSSPVIAAYVGRVMSRPAITRARARDDQLASANPAP